MGAKDELIEVVMRPNFSDVASFLGTTACSGELGWLVHARPDTLDKLAACQICQEERATLVPGRFMHER